MMPINPLDVGRVPLGHEPKGGDFARYVEQLGNAPRTQGPAMQSSARAAAIPVSQAQQVIDIARKLQTARTGTGKAVAGGVPPAVLWNGMQLKIGTVLMAVGGALLLLSFMIGTGVMTFLGFVGLFIGNAIRSSAKKAGGK